LKNKPLPQSLISSQPPPSDSLPGRVVAIVKAAAEKILALDQLNRIYLQTSPGEDEDSPFPDRILRHLKIRYEVTARDLKRIPKQGPVVVVANHPFGGVEGLILASLLTSVRPDVKLMANFLLERVPDLRDNCIFVDPYDRAGSVAANFKPLREALAWLAGGGMLAVFPAGGVSHVRLGKGAVTDPPWSESVARIIRRTDAAVLPVYFGGSNSLLFQVAGLLHPRLRTALLPHELVNKREKSINPRFGGLIPFAKLAPMSDAAMMSYLRVRTYHLADRKKPAGDEKQSWKLPLRVALPKPAHEPLIEPVPGAVLAAEVADLPAERRLATLGVLEVFYGTAHELPNVLREIGRLREQTFREVEEGTGNALDLDRFDAAYTHLFVWHRERLEVIGAYRLGRADEIMEVAGKKGLYTSTLFKFRKKLLKRLGPALELGRSFIRLEYQRHPAALLMLWKGLAHYVALNPDYKMLFGPVSITHEYQSMSKHLLAAFLKHHEGQPELAKLVRPRKPLWIDPVSRLKLRKLRTVANNLNEVDELISDIETKFNGMPVLLRQYLRLGGKLLAFNVDPDFCHVLDGLIVVDLTKSDRRLLARYMGGEKLVGFLAHHGLTAADGNPAADPDDPVC
jgi:putative hemolysin